MNHQLAKAMRAGKMTGNGAGLNELRPGANNGGDKPGLRSRQAYAATDRGARTAAATYSSISRVSSG